MVQSLKRQQRELRLGMVGGGPESNNGGEPGERDALFPTVEDGVLGVPFVDAAVSSHQQAGRWVPIAVDLQEK